MPHDVMMLFKGFDGDIPETYREVLSDIKHESIFVEDKGFDIGPYFEVVQRRVSYFYLFLNSFSEILADDWMAILFGHVTLNGVGAAGATGSWESRMAPAPIRIEPPVKYAYKKLRSLIWRRSLQAFPNFHLRTNAFIASRSVLLKLEVPRIKSKNHTLAFESGPNGFTKQLHALNRRMLVSGRDGQAYEKEDWFKSATFKQKSQDNLLIADNQTKRFLLANPNQQCNMSISAWGDKSEFYVEGMMKDGPHPRKLIW
jgi:hypothetical protein